MNPTVTIVIPGYNRPDLLRACLKSIREYGGAGVATTVVDNASPESLEQVRIAFPEVRWIRLEHNVGYAGANNLGLNSVESPYVCLLNADAELLPGTIDRSLQYLASHPEAAAATPRNVGFDGKTQPFLSPEHTLTMAWLRDSALHLIAPNLRVFQSWQMSGFDWNRTQQVATTQTTCLIVRTEFHRKIGGMDERLFLFYNDVDYCRRLREHGPIAYVAEAAVLHHGSASVKTAPWVERQLWSDRSRYYRKWYGLHGWAATATACLSRLAARCLSQVVTGRIGSLPRTWREGVELLAACRAGSQDGV